LKLPILRQPSETTKLPKQSGLGCSLSRDWIGRKGRKIPSFINHY